MAEADGTNPAGGTDTARWIPGPHGPMLAWLSVPQRPMIGVAALLCPPIGPEATAAYPALQALAGRLRQLGVPSLRFDYDGTGDSAGAWLRHGGVPAWKDSILAAGAELARAGAPRLVGVGVRLGATLLAEVLSTGSFHRAVLWDPCATGKRFLREQQALLGLHGAAGPLAAEGIETAGYWWDAEAAAACRRLDLAASLRGSRVPVLALLRDPSAGWVGELTAAGMLEVGDAPGQAQMLALEPPPDRVPAGTVERIAAWVAASAGQETAFRPPAAVAEANVSEADVAEGDTGESDPLLPVVERVGRSATGLFLVETRPATRASDLTVVFVNAPDLSRIGPGRLWVDAARAVAASGARAIRFDVAGAGDSPPREGWPAWPPFPPTAIDDVTAVAAEAGGAVLLVGLCAGAYSAAEAAARHPELRLLAFNPMFHGRTPELDSGRQDPRRRLSHPRRGWMRRGLLTPNPELAESRPRRHPPLVAWWAADLVGYQRSPSRAVVELAGRGVHARMVCGPPEAAALRTGRPIALRRALRSGRVSVEVLPDLDHALWDLASREAALGLVLDEVACGSGPQARWERAATSTAR